jgi:hypothetical protein
MLQALPSSRGYRAKAASVPAPVGGLNSRDSIDAMPPTDALIMSNFFPTVEKGHAARWLYIVLHRHWHRQC